MSNPVSSMADLTFAREVERAELPPSRGFSRSTYLITTGTHMSDPSSDTEEVRRLLILYATETGNAQDAADYIARECRRIRFQCRVASVDSYSLVRTLAHCREPCHSIITISDGSHFRKYCRFRHIHHWFWCRTSIHDSPMDKSPPFRSAT
jgi:sulfite reductase alpha subunit-like flavoprotein